MLNRKFNINNYFVSKGLEENGIQACSIKPGIQGCLNAKKRGLNNIVCSDLDNTGFKSGSIPSIGIFDVIEHIEKDNDFLNKIDHILRGEGGIINNSPCTRLFME